MTYMSQPGPSRRYVILLITASALVSIFFVAMFRGSAEGTRHPDYAQSLQETWDPMMSAETLTGPVIASKLGNETTKYEHSECCDDLGQANGDTQSRAR